jgi:hypothetical protein
MNDFYYVVLPTLGLLFLMMIVSAIYWFRGKQQGILEAVAVFNEYEPDAVARISKRLRDKFDVELEN